MSHAPEIAAGWYQDPHDASQWRWWDGVQWSENTAPMQSAQAAVPVASLAAVPVPVAATQQATSAATAPASDDPWAQSRYIVCQKIVAIGSRYEVRLPSPATVAHDKPADGELVLFVQRKRIALKERIWFRDEHEAELFELVAPKVFNLTSRYELRTPDGTPFAVIKKRIGLSFWRTTWRILDGTGTRELAWSRETSAILALGRRIGDVLPFGGVLNLFPYDFTIYGGADTPQAHQALGTYRRRYGVRDRYDLDLRDDPSVTFDRRQALGLAIALDVLQNR